MFMNSDAFDSDDLHDLESKNGDFDDSSPTSTGSASISPMGALGSAGSLSTAENRQRQLLKQRQLALKRQMSRRNSGGVVQSNHAFLGSSKKIPVGRTSSLRHFSAPKAIDPLQGEDAPGLPVKTNAYASSYRGGFKGAQTAKSGLYSAEYEDNEDTLLPSKQSNDDTNKLNDDTEEQKEDEKPALPPRTRPYGGVRQVDYESKEDQPQRKQSAHSDEPRNYSKTEAKSPIQRTPSTQQETPQYLEETNDQHDTVSTQRNNEITISAHDRYEEKTNNRDNAESKLNRRGIPSSYDPTDASIPSDESTEQNAPIPTRSKQRKSPKNIVQESKEDGEEARRKFDEEGKSDGEEQNQNNAEVHDGFEHNFEDEQNDDEGEEGLQELDLKDMRSFLTSATPKQCGTIQCYIERNRVGPRRLYPEYTLYLKDGDRFLLAAKKRAKNRTSNYIISMDAKDFSRDSGNFVGKLRSNFVGTEFSIYDHGLNPKNSDPNSLRVNGLSVREELGTVLYASNVLSARGPRKMRVAVPALKPDGNRMTCRPVKKADEIVTRFKERDLTDLIELINKSPRWNEQVGAYVLNFKGRVTMASVKNFQLVRPEDEDRVILQFGKVGKDLFTMDYSYPLSPMQAFCIALSSCDNKLACE